MCYLTSVHYFHFQHKEDEFFLFLSFSPWVSPYELNEGSSNCSISQKTKRKFPGVPGQPEPLTGGRIWLLWLFGYPLPINCVFWLFEDKTGRHNLMLAVWTCVRPKKNFLMYDKRMQETDNINKINASCASITIATQKGALIQAERKRWRRTSWRCARVCVLRHVWLLAIPGTVDCQAPLSMGLSWQEYWMGYTCSLSWIPLSLPSPYHASGSSECTSPKMVDTRERFRSRTFFFPL